jgi:hypothetical protein
MQCKEHDTFPSKLNLHAGTLQGQAAAEVTGDEFRSAEPDVLRKVATELVRCWNE